MFFMGDKIRISLFVVGSILLAAGLSYIWVGAVSNLAQYREVRADIMTVTHSIDTINSRSDDEARKKDLKVETVDGYAVITVGDEVEVDRVPLGDGVTIETSETVNTSEHYMLHGITERLKSKNRGPLVYVSDDED